METTHSILVNTKNASKCLAVADSKAKTNALMFMADALLQNAITIQKTKHFLKWQMLL